MKRKNNGFTLVELLAVIIVLALIITIAIPSVLNTTNRAKKQAFFLYGQNLESKATAKYTQDQDNDETFDGCKVYDIKDLYTDDTITEENNGEVNTEYEGWIKVSRELKNTERKNATIIIQNSNKNIEYIKYCVAESDSCVPDKSYIFNPEDREIIVTHTLKEKQTLCTNYSINSNNELKENQGLECMSYERATGYTKDVKYVVTLTYKSRDYAVENFEINGTITQKDFDKAIKEFKDKYQSREVNKLQISSPTCKAGDEVLIKGTTTAKDYQEKETTNKTTNPICKDLTDDQKKYYVRLDANGGFVEQTMFEQCSTCDNNVELPEPEKSNHTFDGWYLDKQFTNKVVGNNTINLEKNPKRNTEDCIIGYKDIFLYAKWIENETETTTTQKYTEHSTETTTTKQFTETTTTQVFDITDHSLLLENLSVSGYKIDFSPIKFYYEVTIPNNETSININAKAETPNTTTVTITGNQNIPEGDHVVIIKLTNNETKKESVYRILVSRLSGSGERITQSTQPIQEEWTPDSGLPDPKLDESNAQLSSLLISGYVIDFDPSVYEYVLKVTKLDPLPITATPKSKKAIVNIYGNEKLEDGSIVEVYVQSGNGYYNKRYKIEIKLEEEVNIASKYVRNVLIVLSILAALIILVSMTNKKRKFSVIKKTVVNNQNENNNQ